MAQVGEGRWRGSGRLRGCLLLAAALAAAGCSGSDGAVGDTGGAGSSADGGVTRAAQGGAALAEAKAPAALDVANRGSLPSAVIRTGELVLAVGEGRVGRAAGAAGDIADRLGGYVLDTAFTRRDGRVARVVLRVPADRFAAALRDLRELGRVERAETHGEDVSLDLVDLGARLRNLEAQRAALVRLLDRAQTVAATIRVQRVLADVQLAAEQAEARLRYLRDRAALSTITVELRERAEAAPAQPARLARAFDDAVDAFAGVVAAAIVAVGFALPIALLGLAALGAFLLGRRALRARPRRLDAGAGEGR